MKQTKRDLWLRLNRYNFEHLVPSGLLDHITELFGGTGASTKAFADKLSRKLGWSNQFARRAIAEYKKFVYLGVTGDFTVTPSKVIDQVWHQHQLFNRAYREFCSAVLGRHFDHYPELVPNDNQTGVFQAQYLETLDLYRREFNMEPPEDIWSVPKFKGKEVKRSGFESRKKGKDESFACTDSDTPLYMLFDGFTSENQTHQEFEGGGGGQYGGAGASSSWDDSSQGASPGYDAATDSGGHDSGGGDAGGGDSGGSSCGGSGCSSGCGGGD